MSSNSSGRLPKSKNSSTSTDEPGTSKENPRCLTLDELKKGARIIDDLIISGKNKSLSKGPLHVRLKIVDKVFEKVCAGLPFPGDDAEDVGAINTKDANKKTRRRKRRKNKHTSVTSNSNNGSSKCSGTTTDSVGETNGSNSSNGHRDPKSSSPDGQLSAVPLKSQNCNANETNNDDEVEMVPIGTGHTLVPKHVLDRIEGCDYKQATVILMEALFTKEELATHTLASDQFDSSE